MAKWLNSWQSHLATTPCHPVLDNKSEGVVLYLESFLGELRMADCHQRQSVCIQQVMLHLAAKLTPKPKTNWRPHQEYELLKVTCQWAYQTLVEILFVFGSTLR